MATPQQHKPKRSRLKVVLAVLGWSFLAIVVVAVILVAVALRGLSQPRPPPPARLDSAALREMINIDIPISTVKWEVFRSPDDSFFPAPDVETILIAEIELSDPSWYRPHDVIGTSGGVTIEAPRAWLSRPFNELMRKAVRDDHALAAFKCTEFATSIKSSGRPIDGFMCGASGRVLVYLTVDGPPQ